VASGIIVGGEEFPVEFKGIPCVVRTWEDHGVEFHAGDGYNKARVADINMAVWHWTGGEGHPLRMAETLRKRKYGIEFAIGAREPGELGEGLAVIYQFCDPLIVDTADAGFANSRSVGVEMVNYGFRKLTSPRRWITPRVARDRPIYEAPFRDRLRRFADFYDHQYGVAKGLAETLSRCMDIPLRVYPGGPRTVPRDEMDAWPGGHVGHYHLSKRKSDPGPRFMDKLNAHFVTLNIRDSQRPTIEPNA